MTDTPDIVERTIAEVQKRGEFRTRYEGQEPRVDEVLVAELLRLRGEVERLTGERDEAKAEVARYWTSADLKPWVDKAKEKGLGHFGKKLKGMFSRAAAAERRELVEANRADALQAQLEKALDDAAALEAKQMEQYYEAASPNAAEEYEGLSDFDIAVSPAVYEALASLTEGETDTK